MIDALWACLATVAALPGQGAATGARAESTEEVLGRVRAAVGWERFVASGMDLVLRGTCSVPGVDEPLTIRLSPEGFFLEEEEGGATGRTIGFDGSTFWLREPDGPVWKLDFGPRHRASVRTWFLGGFWLDPRAPVDRTALAGPDASVPTLVARIRGSPVPVVLRIDRGTWLPASIGYSRPSIEYSMHERVLGLALPRQVVFFGGGLPEVSWTVQEIDVVPSEGCAPFAEPPEGRAGARFVAGVPTALETRNASGNRILVRALAEGERVWMLFDSGAEDPALVQEVAEELHLAPSGEQLVQGTSGTAISTLRRGRSLRLGPLVLEEPLYRVQSFRHWGERPAFDGVVGGDVLARAVVEVDLASGSLVLHAPGPYELPSGGRWQLLRFDGPVPCVEATFEGNRTGWFRLDTGAEGGVHFHEPAVRALRLLAGRPTVPGYSAGAAAVARDLRGWIAWLDLGGRRFSPVPATFAVTPGGGMADPYVTGTIGTGLLQHYRLVLDCRNERIAFLPRRR